MSRAFGVVALILAGLLIPRAPLQGQSLTHGALEGVIQDTAAMPLYDAVVVLRDLATGAERSAMIRAAGRFHFMLLPPGQYELLVERFGYRPLRIRDIAVRPGQSADIRATLAPTDVAAARTDTIFFAARSLGGVRTGSGQEFGALELSRLPDEHRDLTWLTRLSTAAIGGLTLEGLPAQLRDVVVDGVPLSPLRHPRSSAGEAASPVLPLTQFSGAELTLNGLDVEWPGQSGAVLSGYTRRGTPEFRVAGFGRGALVAQPAGAPGGLFHGTQAGVVASGPIVRDTASFVLGLEAWRSQALAIGIRDGDALTAQVRALASDSFGVTGVTARGPVQSSAVAGFMRLDWQVAANHALTARSNFAWLPEGYEGAAAVRGGGSEGRYEGQQLSLALDFTSRIADRIAQEIRVSGEFARREYHPLEELSHPDLPLARVASTRVLVNGLPIGLNGGLAGDLQQTTVRAAETLHLTTGPHQLKFGVTAAVRRYQYSDHANRTGEFIFSGLEGFASGNGVFSQSSGTVADADFAVPEFSGFIQDSWRAAPGLSLLFGARFDAEALPRDDLELNEEWLARTGLDNTDIPAVNARLSPRAGFVWDVQQRRRWMLSGGAGMFTGSLDPTILGEALTHDVGLDVRRGAGTVGSWPRLPDSTIAPVLGRRLTVLAPGYTAPRTIRGNLGLTRVLGRSTAVQVGLGFRRTDFLPRRRDLNLLPVAGTHDQNGRPIYGALQKVGELLVAQPGTNRRFPGFDQVIGVNADGWSVHRSVTLGAEHRTAAFSLTGSYTFARTRDNWALGRGTGEDLLPFPEEPSGPSWDEGISDLDVPHRLVLAGEVTPSWLSGFTVAAIYSYRSGYPFTPGFREGVDINGDGSAANDPAFVADMPGLDRLRGEWECLAESAGRFAERNSCRGAGAHGLDVRFNVRLARPRSYTLSLMVDGLNLTAAESVFPDRALYSLDGAGPLSTSPAGVVTVPLNVNENFGEPLLRLGSGRVLRLGFLLNY